MLKKDWFQKYEEFKKTRNEYKQYVGQFFSTGWGNEYTKSPPKTINKRELEIIREKRLLVDKLKRRYQEARSTYWM